MNTIHGIASLWPYAAVLVAYLAWGATFPLFERLVAVVEARYAQPAALAPDVPMPMGLIQMANDQGAAWAAEDMIAAMKESYAECRDWSMVASLFADAGRDVTSQRIVS